MVHYYKSEFVSEWVRSMEFLMRYAFKTRAALHSLACCHASTSRSSASLHLRSDNVWSNVFTCFAFFEPIRVNTNALHIANPIVGWENLFCNSQIVLPIMFVMVATQQEVSHTLVFRSKKKDTLMFRPIYKRLSRVIRPYDLLWLFCWPWESSIE